MAILVGQLIEILQRYDRDREVTIHTLKGETVEVNGYFVQRDLNDNAFYLTDLDVIPSAHGYHLITIGFDTNQFAQQLAIRNLDSIDIQKDNPTLLYFDTAD